MCARCQGNPVIKALFVDNATANATCPLCENPLSRTMYRWCLRDSSLTIDSVLSSGGKEATSSTPNPPLGHSRITKDLDEQVNPLPNFLKKFKTTYGYLGGVDHSVIVPKRNISSPTNGTSIRPGTLLEGDI